MKSTRETLRALREDKDLKQSELAAVIGTTQQQYSKYETGESELPLRAIRILADFYQVTADYLIGRTDHSAGISALNAMVSPEYSVGALVSDVLSLDAGGRQAVAEYVQLQKLREKYLGKQ